MSNSMVGEKRLDSETKAEIVLSIITKQKTLQAACNEYGISISTLTRWRKQFLDNAASAFRTDKQDWDKLNYIASLERKIRSISMQLEFPELMVFDELPVSFWVSFGRERDYAICFWNKGAEQIYGYTKEEAIGVSFVDLFVDEHAKAQAKIDTDRVIYDDKFVHPSNCIALDRNKNGEEVVLLTNVFKYEYKGIKFQAETAVNLTTADFLMLIDDEYREKRSGEHHETERTLEAFVHHSRDLIGRERTLWSRTFAHEIRSELSSIRHSLDSLVDNFVEIRNTDFFRDIERATRDLYLISQNFLFSSTNLMTDQLQTNYAIKQEKFSLIDQLQSTIEEYKYWASLRALKLKITTQGVGESPVELQGTQEAFLSVMRNLISNAIKHSDSDAIFNETENLSPILQVELTCEISKQSLIVRIVNYGQLSIDQIENKFRAYYKKRDNPSEGLHLGLSIAKQWVDQIHGKLDLENLDNTRVITKLEWPRA